MLDGADTPTTEVAAEDADDEPPAFVAVTTERIVLPTSLLVSVYELPEAPEIPTQPPPELPQSSHAYPKPDGLPDHPPLLVDSVRPSCAVPLIAGDEVATGGGGGFKRMTAVGSEDAEVGPANTNCRDHRTNGLANVTVAQRIARRYGPGDVLAAAAASITVLPLVEVR